MNYVIYIILFLLGSIIGSFLNVVVLRYNTGLSPLKGRSKCFSCGRQLFWQDMVPILSFLIQSGRCRYCGASISIQYPLVEFMAGLLLPLVYIRMDFSSDFIFFLFIFYILLAISIYDFRHKIIPNGLVYGFIFIAFVRLSWIFLRTMEIDQNIILSTAISFLFFASLWFFSRGRWMGFGDAKLAFGIGLATTACQNFSVVAFSFILGAIVSIVYVLLVRVFDFLFNRSSTIETEIPFAPFLVASFFLVFFTGFNYCSFLAL